MSDDTPQTDDLPIADDAFPEVYAGATPPPPAPPWWLAVPPPPAEPPRPTRRARRGLTPLLVAVALVVGLLGGRAIGTQGGGGTGSASFRFPNGVTPPANGSDATSAAGKVAPAIVNITTTLDGGAAAGTGMIITSSGEVLTNNHVINGATKVRVELSDGSHHDATVLGYDVTHDVALIKVSGVSDLPTISTAGASTLRIGQPVVALGNALGQGGAPSVVNGTITALDETITASDQGGSNAETLHGLIESNAPIQPGDSGGALASASGKVIGMNTAASTSRGFGYWRSGGTTASQGYAIPIDRALAIAHQIDAGDGSSTVHIGTRGIIGVELQSDASDSGGPDGAVVAQVEDGSPAATAGMQPGVTIVAIDGRTVTSQAELQAAMAPHHAGDCVAVTWIDGAGARHAATVTLIAGPPA